MLRAGESIARFTGPHDVKVNGETLTAPRIFIDAGGRAAKPDMQGIESIKVLDNTDMVALDQVPPRRGRRQLCQAREQIV